MRALPVILLIACGPFTAGAQPPPQSPASAFVGLPVAEIRLVVEGKPTEDPTVLELIETHVGDPLSMAAVRESITHLFSLGRFEDIQVEATPVAGGVFLRYNLIPVHNVTRVDYHGTLGITEGALRKRVTERFGTFPPVGRADDVAHTIEQQIYPDFGYLRARATWTKTQSHNPDRTVLVFEIEAGPRARVGRVDLSGDPGEPPEAFKSHLRAVPGVPYEPETTRGRLGDFERNMRKRGRYLATTAYAAHPSPDGTVVDLTIDANAGPLVKIAFEGDPVPALKVADLVPLEREGAADEDLIEDSARRIQAHLNQLGYWKAKVDATRREGTDTLTIVFTVHRGLAYRVADAGITVSGNTSVPIVQLYPFFAKLQPGDLFVEASLRAAADAIKGKYQRLGFKGVKIEALPVELDPAQDGHGLINPSIAITEGARFIVGAVTFEGNTSLSERQLDAAVKSEPGAPYFEPQVAADQDAVGVEYADAGFMSAEVKISPVFVTDGAQTRADLPFKITEGPQIIVGHIIIVGNTRTDRRVIEREILLKPGQPLALDDLLESQRRLAALQLFRRVRVAALSHGNGPIRDLQVTVEEAAATTTSEGGGLEVSKILRSTGPSSSSEQYEFAPRGFFDISRRNLGGKNRAVNLYTRVSLRSDTASQSQPQDVSGFGFIDYRVVGTYREPRALGTNADLTLTAAVEQGVRTIYNFARKGVNAEVIRRLKPGLRASGRYSLSTTRTFDEQLTEDQQATIDRLFPQVRLSAFAGAISRDTRDDVLEPSRGTFMSAEGTLAARVIGGEVGFLKSYVQGLWFQRMPSKRRIIFATRAAVGLADGFPRSVLDVNGTPVVVEDLPASERFFAGGDTTIRGFAQDGVGVGQTISPSGLAKGGNAVLIMNAELRVPLWKDFGTALFVDGGNVFERVTDFDFGELRGAVGVGLRYKSKFGPVRLDVGFKLDRRTVGGDPEPRRAFHFSIGQAF
jgi:outer membrane protein insertion porin family